MNYVRKVLSALGGIFLATLLIAALAPKAARGVAAALVQIVPGNTTHIGQHESQLVSLYCFEGSCNSIDPTGALASTAYVVPSGYTLIVTDWEWTISGGQPGALNSEELFIQFVQNPLANSQGLSDIFGQAAAHEHYGAGIRVGSGHSILDTGSILRLGFSFVYGYLVPN
jgi:hypothetical protein